MKFRFFRDALDVEGAQNFIVEAKDLEEAKVLCDGPNAVFDFEEIGVTDLGSAYGFEQVPDDYTPEVEAVEAKEIEERARLEGLERAFERAVVMLEERIGECPNGYHESNEEGYWEPEETCEVLSDSGKCNSLTCWKKYLTRK